MNDALVEKVRKLLAKTTQNGCSAEEAEAAYKMASRLMAEHNLSMADVEFREAAAEEVWTEESILDIGRWSREYDLAYGIVHRFFFVQGFFVRGSRGPKSLKFFGKPENVEVARHTFMSLLEAFDRLWADYRIRNRRPANERTLFVIGVAGGFRDKLAEEREAMQMEHDILQGTSGGTGIALRRIEDRTIEKFREKHGKCKSSRTNFADPRGDQSTLRAGFEAGRNLSLNKGIGGSTGPRAIGG